MNYRSCLGENLRHDILYTWRQIRLAPSFAMTVILTMALGIGATTAIFSLIQSVMLRSLPVVDPTTLYRVEDGHLCCNVALPQGNWGLYSYELFQRLRDSVPEFEQFTAFQGGRSHFSVRREHTDKSATSMTTEYVMGNYFETIGIHAYAGRAIEKSDDQASAPSVAVLSYRVWQQQYGSDPTVLGTHFIIEGHPFTIIGITPPGFFGETLSSDPPTIWIPLQQERVIAGPKSQMDDALWGWLRVIGRLKQGTSTNTLSARLTAALQQWFQYESKPPAAYRPQLPKLAPRQHIHIIPGGEGVNAMREQYGESLYLLFSVSGLVLLIACANMANLLLVRGESRRALTAVRIALGASRTRLMQQVLTESLVLSFCGGIAGILVAYVGVKFIVRLTFPHAHDIPISPTPQLSVLVFALGLSCITGILFGTAPAWFASRAQPLDALRGASHSTRNKSSLPQRAFVVLQASFSFVLLFGAGLLTHSLKRMEHQSFGYELDHRISVQMAGPLDSYSPEKLDELYNKLLNRLSRIPGVQSAALAQSTPFLNEASEFVIRRGEDTPDVNSDHVSYLNHVSPGYLATMGESVIRGRGLTVDDTQSTRNVAVVDENFVHRFFKPGENPLGMYFGLIEAQYSSTYQIVGVVSKTNYYDPSGREAEPLFFAPLAQYAHYDTQEMQGAERQYHILHSIVFQTPLGIQELESQLINAIGEVDPNLSIRLIQTMREQVYANFDQQRAIAQLSGLFGAMALLLASIGQYGVMTHMVDERKREIGIRLALGAARRNILLFILQKASIQIALGVVLGIPLAIGFGRLIAAHLYQVESWDPITLLLTITALGLPAFAASMIPARRASRIDPNRILRAE
jgi:predicted permease